MPLPAPTTEFTKINAKFAEAVAAATVFQQLAAENDAAGAALKVFGRQVRNPARGNAYAKSELIELQAYAQVYPAPDDPFGVRRDRSNYYWPYGASVLYVERHVPESRLHEDDVPELIEQEFDEFIGLLINHLYDWLDINGGPWVRDVRVTDGPGFNDRDKWQGNNCWQGVEITIQHGLPEQ